jgi:hypothetical protein
VSPCLQCCDVTRSSTSDQTTFRLGFRLRNPTAQPSPTYYTKTTLLHNHHYPLHNITWDSTLMSDGVTLVSPSRLCSFETAVDFGPAVTFGLVIFFSIIEASPYPTHPTSSVSSNLGCVLFTTAGNLSMASIALQQKP